MGSMNRIICCLSVLIVVAHSAPQNVFKFEIKRENGNGSLKKLRDFSFKDCGGQIAHAHSLSVTPDPLQFPGTFNLGFNVTTTAALESPLKLSLSLEKELLGKYIKIPCVDNFGSCTYLDLCSIIQPVDPCPDELKTAGIPCQCPYKAGNYILPTVAIDVDADPFPTGGYHIQANVTAKSQLAVCLDLYLSVSD